MANYRIGNTLSTAWHHVKGTKWPIWATYFVIFGIYGISMMINHLVMPETPRLIQHTGNITTSVLYNIKHIQPGFFQHIIYLLPTLITLPLITGMLMTALKKLRGEPVSSTTGLQYWHQWWPLVCGYLLVVALLSITAALFIGISWMGATFNSLGIVILVQCIMLLIGLLCLFPLCTFLTLFTLISIADNNSGALTALKDSWRLIKPHWLRIIGLYYTVTLLIAFIISVPAGLGMLCPIVAVKVLGFITSGILLIWLLPYSQLIIANTYKKLSS